MDGIFEPPKRVLSLEQFDALVLGKGLSALELQVMREDCSLRVESPSPDPNPEGTRIRAWLKVVGCNRRNPL